MHFSSMVVIGGGKAGTRAVVGFRGNEWQGSVALINDERLLPYDRPPLSKAVISDEADPAPTTLLDEDMIASLGVTHFKNSAVVNINRNTQVLTLNSGQQILYHRLLIAVGASARKLAVPGADRALLLRDFADALKIRAACQGKSSIVIIGGGFIGLELAASASRHGCKVTVIENRSQILMRAIPEIIAEKIRTRHEMAGVKIITSAAIERIEPKSVVLSNGAEIEAQTVIAGIGAAPRTSLAQMAGLEIDNGIKCNAEMQTSDPYIYAAGDCCSFPHPVFDNERMRLEAWRNASDQAVVAVENMLGGKKIFTAVPWFWSDQYELSIQIAGLPHLGTSTITRTLSDKAFILCHLNAEGEIVGASGIGPGNSVARDIRLLELLIGKQAQPYAASLADASFPLKTLLK